MNLLELAAAVPDKEAPLYFFAFLQYTNAIYNHVIIIIASLEVKFGKMPITDFNNYCVRCVLLNY